MPIRINLLDIPDSQLQEPTGVNINAREYEGSSDCLTGIDIIIIWIVHSMAFSHVVISTVLFIY